MSEKTFVYVEFEALSSSGHRINTANQYATKLRSYGWFDKHVLIGSRTATNASNVKEALHDYDRIELALSPLNTPADQRLNILDVSRELAASIRASTGNRTGPCLVYTHMPSPFALTALYLTIRELAEKSSKSLTVLVRLCMIDEEWAWYRFRLSRLIATINRDQLVKDLFAFTTESTRLNSYYSENCGLTTSIQFNPFPEEELVLTRSKHRHHRTLFGKRINLAFLGEAREEKGFQYLPILVRTLRAAGIEFRFCIHCFANSVNDTALIREAREALRSLMTERAGMDISMVEVPVPRSLYTAHQRLADIIVMPYKKKPYNIRGSGVAFEAICSNAFILVTADTDIGATFAESGRVVEYDPALVNVEALQEVCNKVLEARAALSTSPHPAHLYKEHFFEFPLERMFKGMLTRTGSTTGAVVPSKDYELLRNLLQQHRGFDALCQQMQECGLQWF